MVDNKVEEAKEKEKEPKSKKDEDKEPDLSEEDKQLQDELNMLVERLTEPAEKLYKPSLESLRTLIRSSTTSMTSVPKPLKFLRPHYATLKAVYEKIRDIETKKFCADVVSVLGMTMGEGRDCLKYRMLGSHEDIGSWGHEYVKHLTGEVSQEWQEIEDDNESGRAKLMHLVNQLVPYLMEHNAEPEACDLLMEIEKLDSLQDYVDVQSHKKVCLYLTSCVPYVPDPENINLLKATLKIYLKFGRHSEAMRVALQLNQTSIIEDVFKNCRDLMIQKQLSFQLGAQQYFLELDDEVDVNDDLMEIMRNSSLSNHFLALGRELDIMEPKVPEDIYKSHLEPTRTTLGANVDSARQNLASSFVNGFVNAAFGQDKLLMEDGNKWLYKNKEHGMMSAAATLGMLLLWDVDTGLNHIDKYIYSSEPYIKSGALLACGIVNSGVKNACDPAQALLCDYVLHQNNIMRIGAIMGLGLAYAGSNREDVLNILLPVMGDSKSNMEVIGVTALACGLISVGHGNSEVSETILQTLLEKSEAELKDTFAKFLALGIGLTYLGKQDEVETILAALEAVPEQLRSLAHILVDTCAFAGTGNVLKVQHLLHICSEHYETKEEKEEKEDKKKDKKEKDKKEKKEDKDKHTDLTIKQSAAVLGISLVAMGEDIGSEMVFRSMGHLLRYGEPAIRRAVPLALGLISTSNPRLTILDTLSKFSHDNDPEVTYNSIIAMGLVGAGTNNARLAAMLRQLAIYHAKDPNQLFCVRLAQGLVHMGKGTLTLSPYHSDRQLLSPVALGGLLALLISMLDVKNTILGKSHYLFFSLVSAIRPRMLVTLSEELQPLPVSVRVGQAVDVVGQAGKPKTITGFQTHTTPVLLAYGERAELATEEYLTLTDIMEGFVILKKNPDYVAEETAK